MNEIAIEDAARYLQRQIWRERARLWPDRTPDLLDMLDPAIAASILGINFEYCEDMGRFGYRGTQFEVAGMLDRRAGVIAVSRKFTSEVMRFTGAHEVGHWVLHPGEVMHRDRPINGLTNETVSYSPHEREANYFAACFLMPRKLLIKTFESTFLMKPPFIFNEITSFWLCPSDHESLLRPDNGSWDRAASIASAESYSGRHFNSLSKQFRVSVKTMAIRLTELELIRA